MNKITVLFLFLTAGVFLAGCSSLDAEKEFESIYLRIANTSPVDFTSVYVSFPGDESTFEAIESGRVSEYKKLSTAYRYGYIAVKSNENTYSLQPIDYVGEEPLEKGRYTFQLDIDGENLTLNFIEE